MPITTTTTVRKTITIPKFNTKYDGLLWLAAKEREKIVSFCMARQNVGYVAMFIGRHLNSENRTAL